MKKYSFDLGTTNLEILCNQDITTEKLDIIFKLIQFIRYDFNHIIHNSSAYRFNSAKADTPVLVSPEFAHYLNINISESDKSDLDFLPFYSKNKTLENEQIKRLIKVEDNLITKNTEILLKSNLLLQSYLIDLLVEHLKTNKFKSFLIQTKNFARAIGTEEWDIKLEVESDYDYEAKIQNEAIGVHNLDSKKRVEVFEGFARKDTPLDALYSINKTSTCIDSKIYSYLLSNITTKSGFDSFAKEYKTTFIIIDSNFDMHEFS